MPARALAERLEGSITDQHGEELTPQRISAAAPVARQRRRRHGRRARPESMAEAPAAQRIAQLRDEINGHDYRYYILNEPAVPDAEYDRLMNELRALEARAPGAGHGRFADAARVGRGVARVRQRAARASRCCRWTTGSPTRTWRTSIARCASGWAATDRSTTRPTPKLDGLADLGAVSRRRATCARPRAATASRART